MNIPSFMVYLKDGSVGKAIAPGFNAGRGKSGLHRAGSPFQSPGNAGYERRMLRTISRRKESATEKKPPGQPGKGEKVGQKPTGHNAKAVSLRQTPSAARPNREQAAARSVTSSGFWSHRQMIAAGLARNRIRLISSAASVSILIKVSIKI